MSSSTTLRKPLGVRATPEEHKRITKAAKRANRSVNSFVLQAALQAAETKPVVRPRRSPEEIKAILDGFRAAVRSVVPEDRDILSEFLADRRAEAERA
jgi:hypothetical protein